MNAECKPDESEKPSGRRGFIDIIHTLFRFRKRSHSNPSADSSAYNLSDEIRTNLTTVTREREVPSIDQGSADHDPTVANRFIKSSSYLPSTTTESHEPGCQSTDHHQLPGLSNDHRLRRISNVSVVSSPESQSVSSAVNRRGSTGTSSSTSIVTLHYHSSIRTFRNLDKDLETLRLSRHDNPVLQRKMMQSYISEPEVAFSNVTSHQRHLSRDSGHLSQSEREAETLILKPLLLGPPKSQLDFLSPNDYHPLNVIQQHLVRSPPPYISSMRQFGYEVGRNSASSDSEQEEFKRQNKCTCETQGYYVHAEEIQRAPLPHVRQSCPMFRPLVTMQKGIFQDHRDHRKQPKDLRPLLSLSSDDVIDAGTYTVTKNRRRHFEASHQQGFNVQADGSTESNTNSPSIQVLPKRNKRRSMLQCRHPVTYPLQKTI